MTAAMKKRREKFDWHESGCKCDCCFFLKYIDKLEKEEIEVDIFADWYNAYLNVNGQKHFVGCYSERPGAVTACKVAAKAWPGCDITPYFVQRKDDKYGE